MTTEVVDDNSSAPSGQVERVAPPHPSTSPCHHHDLAVKTQGAHELSSSGAV
jgi:hypothetical protein